MRKSFRALGRRFAVELAIEELMEISGSSPTCSTSCCPTSCFPGGPNDDTSLDCPDDGSGGGTDPFKPLV